MTTQTTPKLGARLSPRERQILHLVAEGQMNTQIATATGLSAFTVKGHLARIGRKLGHGTRAGMVGAAFRLGILQ